MKLGDGMNNEKQQSSKFKWFFRVIFIPIVFALILFSVILSFLGVNALNQAKKVASNVPFLSEYVRMDEQHLEEGEKTNLGELTAEVEARDTEINDLENNIASKEEKIQSLLKEINTLKAQLEEKQEAQLSDTKEDEEIAKIYLSMSAKNAANILSELPEEEAVLHLSFIKANSQAPILAKMAPEKAAKLITLLRN